MALPVRFRLKTELDFKTTIKSGKTVRGDFVFLKYVPSSTDVPRFGISVPAKIIKKAVARNRIRREILKTIQTLILPNAAKYDTVVVVTRDNKKDSVALQEDLLRTAQKSGIIWLQYSVGWFADTSAWVLLSDRFSHHFLLLRPVNSIRLVLSTLSWRYNKQVHGEAQ